VGKVGCSEVYGLFEQLGPDTRMTATLSLPPVAVPFDVDVVLVRQAELWRLLTPAVENAAMSGAARTRIFTSTLVREQGILTSLRVGYELLFFCHRPAFGSNAFNRQMASSCAGDDHAGKKGVT
jgi:hypothetical protein